jgi:hypothetical protein
VNATPGHVSAHLAHSFDRRATNRRLFGCRTAARLTAALKQQRIYRPTEDPSGAHRAQLAELASLAVAAAAAPQAPAAVVGAALEVVEAVLAVEHRAVQDHLPALWPMLWADGAAGGASGAGLGVARALVGAFAELRQLDVLLASLAAAAAAARGAAGAAAVAAVVCSDAFLEALRSAVHALPSGQVSGVVRLVGSWTPLLAAAAGGGDGHAALVLADVSAACLDGLYVDIVTAPAAAEAAAALLASPLAPALLPLLRAAGGRRALEAPAARALAALLRVYGRALSLHAHCCALHPEVCPLPGQGVQPGAGAAGGYFDALCGAAAAPELPALARAAGGGTVEAAAMSYSVMEATAQRLRTLQLRYTYWQHRCGEEELELVADAGPVEGVELAELAASLAAGAAALPEDERAGGRSGSPAPLVPLATMSSQRLAAAAARLAAAHLPELQAWVPEGELGPLVVMELQRGAVAQAGGVLELDRLRAALPAAACRQLHDLLRWAHSHHNPLRMMC